MRGLVTGGAGVIGSAYVRQGVTGAYPSLADAELIVLDKLTYAGNEANLEPVRKNPRYRFEKGDICDGALVNELMRGVDLVVELRARAPSGGWVAGRGGGV